MRAEASLLAQAVRREPPTPEALAGLAARENLPALVSSGEMRAADLVFLVLHGPQGEGGAPGAPRARAHCATPAAGRSVVDMAMDKEVTKRLLDSAGIPTADWAMWPLAPSALDRPRHAAHRQAVERRLDGRTLGRPRARGARRAVALALADRPRRHARAFLPGREFTVGILGEQALAVGEIIPQHEIFDYECKYTPGLTREVFPAEIPAELAREMRELALATHQGAQAPRLLPGRLSPRLGRRALRPRGQHATRHDRTSLLPQSAAAVGISFSDLCAEICRLALAR